MRNPIFSADTLFLDRNENGSINYVEPTETKLLSCGAKLIRLETRQPLVELLTESGNRLVLAPEAVFSLFTEDGCLVRWMPVDTDCAFYGRIVSLKQDPANPSPFLNYFMAGMVCANGRHSFERNRPSSFTVPHAIVPDLVDYLSARGQVLIERKVLVSTPRILPTQFPHGTFVKSRVITTMVSNLLQDKTQVPAFPILETDRPSVWAFLRGVLTAADREGEEIVIRHRYANVLETIHKALWTMFGVPSKLSVNPMESRVTPTRTGIMPHSVRLSAEDRAAAALAGLDDTYEGPPPEVKRLDRIAKITPLSEKTPGVIVLPGEARRYGLTANTFCFEPLFSLPDAIVDLATHPMMVDTSDPTTFEVHS